MELWSFVHSATCPRTAVTISGGIDVTLLASAIYAGLTGAIKLVLGEFNDISCRLWVLFRFPGQARSAENLLRLCYRFWPGHDAESIKEERYIRKSFIYWTKDSIFWCSGFLKKNRCFLLGYLRHLKRKLSFAYLMRWGAQLPRKSLNESIMSDDVSRNIMIAKLSKEIGRA